jgi:HD superfamily phosphohydrolase
MDASRQSEIDEIVNTLTEKLFAHNYMISRMEARDTLKLPVTFSDPQLETLMWELYENYREQLELERPFIPEEIADINGSFSVNCGVIDSINRLDGYVFEGLIQKSAAPNQAYQSNVSITHQGWKTLERSGQ